jgi:type II secretory pathway component PulF
MPEFNYLAVDGKGKTLDANIEAGNLKDARSQLRREGFTLIKIQPVESVLSEVKSSQKGSSKQNKDTKLSLAKTFTKGSAKGEKVGLDFLKRLVELHGSGMPVADAVKLLNHRLSDPIQKEIAGFLWKELAEGRTCREP